MELYQIILIVVASIIVISIITLFLIMNYVFKEIFKVTPNLDKKDSVDCPTVFKDNEFDFIEPILIDLVNKAISYPHEDLYVKSFDGLKLHGVLYRFGDESTPVMICFHGYKGNKFRDFAGGLQIFKDLGYNVLLVDQRGHLESEGNHTSFGTNESKDVLPWVNKVIELYGNYVKIALEGISMGGATVLSAASRYLPENVKCVVADCPFSSPFRVFEYSMKHTKFPKWIIRFITGSIGKIYMKTDFSKYNSLQTLENNKLPILILHGEKDTVCPFEMSKELADKYPNYIKLESFKNANHGVSYFDDNERYWKVSQDFLKSNLK